LIKSVFAAGDKSLSLVLHHAMRGWCFSYS